MGYTMNRLLLYICLLSTAYCCTVDRLLVEQYLQQPLQQLLHVKKSNLIRYRVTGSRVMRTLGVLNEFCAKPSTTYTPTTSPTSPTVPTTSTRSSSSTLASVVLSSLLSIFACMCGLYKCFRHNQQCCSPFLAFMLRLRPQPPPHDIPLD